MKLRSLFFPPPVKARHYKRTLIFSPDDEISKPTPELIDLSLRVIRRTMDTDLGDICARMAEPPYWPEIWPGEHYKLLAAFVAELQPKIVIEVGTETGLSALCMKSALPKDSQLVTFDLIPWNEFGNTVFRKEDFDDSRLTQALGDLGDPAVMEQYSDLLRNADFFFVDGPKDKVFERRFMENLAKIGPVNNPVMVFDDIKDWNMLAIWREMTVPKLDMTSFGHWTGTGLAQWPSSSH